MVDTHKDVIFKGKSLCTLCFYIIVLFLLLEIIIDPSVHLVFLHVKLFIYSFVSTCCDYLYFQMKQLKHREVMQPAQS